MTSSLESPIDRTFGWQGGTVGSLSGGIDRDGRAFLLAGAESGVYTSNDGGDRWQTVAPVESVRAIAALAVTIDAWYAGGWTGLFALEPEGGIWRPLLRTPVHAVVAWGAGDRRVLLAGTELDGVLRSEDGGQSWQSATAGLLDTNVLALAASPARGGKRVVLAGTDGGVYVSRNDGKAWRFASLPHEEVAVQCLAISPDRATNRLAFAGTEGDGLLKSLDGGMSWTETPFFASRGISAIAHTPASASAPLIAVAVERTIAISDDGGETWTPFHETADTIWSLQFIEGAQAWTLMVGQAAAGLLRLECRSAG